MIGHVFKGDQFAATLERDRSETIFRYRADYLASGGQAVATTLPTSIDEMRRAGAAAPAFFAGLLPEGRRLTALTRAVKTSADDDLGLLLAVGTETVGDVCVVLPEVSPRSTSALQIPRNVSQISFAELLASAGITERTHIAGVQDKASAHMISLPASRADERTILKFTPAEFPRLVENEQFFLQAARRLGISVASASVLTDAHGMTALAVRRFDRVAEHKIAVEDGTQVLGRYPADKYRLSFEEVVMALSNVTIAPIPSRLNYLTQLAFAWLSGNGDLHAKNLAVVGHEGGYLTAPMFDLPSSLFYPEIDSELALTAAGKRTLTARRFAEVGRALELPDAATDRVRQAVLRATEGLVDHIHADALGFDRRITDKAVRQMRTRRRDLQ